MSQWPPSQVEEWEPWGFVISGLNWHRKDPRHDWIDTLNRLLRKGDVLGNSQGRKINRKDIPILTPAMLSATREKWSLDQLVAARHWKSHAKDQPKCDQCPILVLCLFGSYFSIDGGKRINRRIRDSDVGPHDVVVIRHTAHEDI